MATVREKCFEHWKVEGKGGFMLPCFCETCNGEVLFNPATTKWQAAHRIHRAWNGSDEPDNVRPMIWEHHRTETHEKDIPEIADAKRKGLKHYGAKEKNSRGFYRHKDMVYDWSKGRYVRR